MSGRTEGYDRGRVEDVGRWKKQLPGSVGFYLHRFTGVVLSLYLILHLAVLGTAFWMGHETFTSVIHLLETQPIVRVLEVGLFAAFVFHALNGLRVVLFDMSIALDTQEQLFYLSVALSFAIVMIGVPFFLL